jgi:hypothetical protein
VVVQLAGIVAEIETLRCSGQGALPRGGDNFRSRRTEDREEVSDRVGVLETARGDILAGAVVRAAVTGIFATEAGVNRAFIARSLPQW